MTARRRDHRSGDPRTLDVAARSEPADGQPDNSIARPQSSTLATASSERLARLVEQSPSVREVAELGRVVYTAAGFDRFLSTPMSVFGGRTALELLESGQVEPVLAALAADYEGLGY